MADVQLYNSNGTQVTYNGVTSLVLPTSGGGTATFTEGGGGYVTAIGNPINYTSLSFTVSDIISVSGWTCVLAGDNNTWSSTGPYVTSIIHAGSGYYVTYANASSLNGSYSGISYSMNNGIFTITIQNNAGYYFMANAQYNLMAVS